MKINPNCVRDVMMFLEDNLSVEQGPGKIMFVSVSLNKILSNEDIRVTYSWEEITYSLFQLIEDGYIVSNCNPTERKIHYELKIGDILYITPKGHKFISSIKDKEAWANKISPLFSKLGSVSLSVIETVASGITSAMLDKYIHGGIPTEL